MRDGVEIAARVFTPTGARGPLPALLSADPYRSSSRQRLDPIDEFSLYADGAAYFARHGYVAVCFDVRGTSSSGGASTDMYSDDDRRDGVEMVEWAAHQPWCDGRVGMWGGSYQGVAAWHVAAQSPPALRAIVVAGATEDVYGDWAYPGGLPRALVVLGEFGANMAATNALPPDPDAVGDRWREIWDERLRGSVPWSIATLEHPLEDAYWRARTVSPDHDGVRCAVLTIAGWDDWYPTATLRAVAAMPGRSAAIVGGWGHVWPESGEPGGRIDAPEVYLRWFDRFVKGEEVAPDPITRVVVRGPDGGVWREGDTWPPPGTESQLWSPTPGGGLIEGVFVDDADVELPTDPAAGVTAGLFGFGRVPDQADDDARALCATSQPLDADLEITGFPRVVVVATPVAAGLYVRVRLCDVAPDGSSTLVTSGGLDLRHRRSRAESEDLVPGEPIEVGFDLAPTSYRVPAGHRIRVALSGADFPNLWPPVIRPGATVRFGGTSGTRIELPVPPALAEGAPAARAYGDAAPAPFEVIREPEQTTVVRPTARFTVSHTDPGVAELIATAHQVVPTPDGDAEVRVRSVIASDAAEFRHTVELEARLAGVVRAERRWETTVLRHPV
jgi:predicted acyl esterase